MNKKEEMLKEIEKEIYRCKKCSLSKFRYRAVVGEGNIDSKIMFVGEAPGKDEDLQGRPFVGEAGKLLNFLMETAGIKREDVYISNVLKCRPPNNRAPQKEEIEKCSSYLITQIGIIQPEVICTLGNFALKLLISEKFSISKVHGKIFKKHGIIYFPMYHPAAALHRNSKEMKEMMLADFRKLKNLILDRKTGGILC